MPVVLDRAAAERLLTHQLRSRRHYHWYPDSPNVRIDLPEVIGKFRKYWNGECGLMDLSKFLGYNQPDEIKEDSRYAKFLLPKDREEMKQRG